MKSEERTGKIKDESLETSVDIDDDTTVNP